MARTAGAAGFQLLETTIDAVQRAYMDKELSARELVQLYLDRIAAYDHAGPELNAVITTHPDALEEADRLDEVFRTSGPAGPLHGVPVILKDQMDAAGTPTTLGSVLLKDFRPGRDAFVVQQLKAAGAIILAKTTLGELGGGDTHGTLFGSTRNPYAPDRTAGGSSGGSGVGVSANFATVAVGQEGFASIRRPAAWNSVVGMRPTAGLVSRTGVYAGWPGVAGSLGPMSRTVRDLATLLDVMVGYDPDDPLTALGARHAAEPYTSRLDEGALRGARIGVLREPMGRATEPDSEDFAKVTRVFDTAVDELAAAGAQVVDPVEIPGLREALAQRSGGDRGGSEGAFRFYFAGSANPPFASYDELLRTPGYQPRSSAGQVRPETTHAHLQARETLFINLLKVMADHRLDAIVHRSVEHQPTLIRDGVNPPHVNSKGATHLNTFLVYVPALSVPAGWTVDDLPVGITFLGRPYSDHVMIRLGHAYEQATLHRRPPSTTPALPGEGAAT